MREIKFRGKRLDNGEWIYGSLLMSEPQEKSLEPLHCFIFLLDKECHRVIPETVGQYTGLKDKNGVEIYEGDIVTGLFNYIDIIGHILYGSNATFFINRKGLYGIGLNNAEDWLEVVGNIYENPELLKQS